MIAAAIEDPAIDHEADPDLLTAALDLAGRGVPVLPIYPLNEDEICSCPKGASCDSPGKHPLGPLVPRGSLDATTDKPTITGWFALWPDANLAIATGPTSGLLVLDIDAKAGGWKIIARFEEEHGELEPTWAVETGGGGLHLWYHYPEGFLIKNSAGKLGPGLDVRGVSGFVICPPSLHHSGNRYTWGNAWHPDRVSLADPPAWLLHRLALPSMNPKRAPSLPDGESIKDGARNNTLASWGGTMRRRGFCEDSILAALRVVNTKRCIPPLDDSEVRKIAHSVAGYAPAEEPPQIARLASGAAIRPTARGVRHGR